MGAGLFDELNFITEASHIARFAETYETPLRQLGVVVPTVDRKLSSTRVLVTEWIDGTPPRDLPPVERQALARTAVRVRCCSQTLASYIGRPLPRRLSTSTTRHRPLLTVPIIVRCAAWRCS